MGREQTRKSLLYAKSFYAPHAAWEVQKKLKLLGRKGIWESTELLSYHPALIKNTAALISHAY